jgi:molecular chaperone GrpE
MTETFKQQEQNPENLTNPSEDLSNSPTENGNQSTVETETTSNLETPTSELDHDVSADVAETASELSQHPSLEVQTESTEEISPNALEEPSASELEQVIAILQQDVASLKSQLDQQIQQTESFKGQYVRLAADFENFRKRTTKEKEDLEYQVKRNTVTELLGAIDSFERARSQIKPANDGEMTIHKSYQGVYKQLVDGLKRIGVSAMRPEGEQFDPNYHEAVFREATNNHPEGTVLEQLVRGYLLSEKVLRHAMVKVAAPGDDESEVTPQETTESVAEESSVTEE